MLELLRLRIKNVGRFVGEHVVDFASMGSFAQMDAENRNTGGSSGSGKSTVFHALEYNLGINDTPASVLQSRLTKDGMCVIGEYLLDGKPLEITRGKSILRVDHDGKIIEGSSALAEEEIDRILGMSRDLFRKTMHKRQKEGGFFMDFTPKKIHEFLADCLGLGAFKKHAETVSDNLDNLIKFKMSIESDLTAAKAALDSSQEAMAALGPEPTLQDVSKEKILELKNLAERSAIRFRDVQGACDQKIQDLEKERPNISVRPPNDSTRESLEERRRALESDIEKMSSKEKERQSYTRQQISEKIREISGLDTAVSNGDRAKDDAARIAAQIKQIRNSKCPTCEQDWVTEAAKEAEDKGLRDLGRLKEVISAGSAATLSLITANAELLTLQSQLEPIVDPNLAVLNEELVSVTEQILEAKKKNLELYEQQNATNKALLDEFKSKQDSLASQNRLEIEQARGQADLDRRVFEAAVAKMRAFEDAKKRYDSTMNSLKEREEKNIKRIDELNEKLTNTTTQISVDEEIKKAIKLYVSYSFDEALELIGKEATKIIRCVPNVSNATIRFDSMKETKDGKVKEEVNAVIDMDGEIGIPIKSLSGGERTAVDLAVDLAVIDFIESRTGKGMNIFILDEPFQGLSSIEIEAVLEVLKNSNSNKKIVIVDHNPEVKQMVQSRTVIIREGLTSRVV